MHVEWALPSWGWPFLLLVAVAAVLWTRRQYRASEPTAPAALRRGLIALRSLAFVLLLLALAGPALYRIHSQQRPAEVVVVLEDSASMALADGGGNRTRWARALQLAGTADSLLAERGQDVRISLVRGNGMEAQRPLAEAKAPPLPPTAVGTDLLALIREVGSRWADRPLRGLVLLCDGNESVRNLSPGEGGGAPAPLLAVGVGDPVGPPDRALQDLRYPDTAFEGDEVVAEVSVASRRTGAIAHGPVTVRLTQGERLVAEATADEVAEDGVTRLELAWRPSATGLQVYELEVAPLDNERYLSNNGTSLAVNVRKERAHLLLLAGRPGWDVRFLAQAAAQEERLQLETVYRGRQGLVLADSDTTWFTPADAGGWERWDGFVLAGWQGLPADFPWGGLVQAVTAGKGLLVLPGAGPTGPGLAGRTALMRPPDAVAEALPVSLDATRWEAGDWLPYAAAEAGQHPVLAGVTHQVAGGVDLASGRLPPLAEVLRGIPRAGSTILLAARSRLEERDPRDPALLVLGALGQGRVAWFGGRPLWELAFWEPPRRGAEEEDQPARRLLRNLLVWTASGDEEAGLTLVGHRTIYQEGEPIRLEAQWRDLRGAPVTDRPLVLSVEPLDSGLDHGSRTFSLAPVPGLPGHAATTLPPLPPGRYRVRPRAGGEPPLEGREAALVVAPHSLEAAQVRQDARRLRQLASGLGGTYLAGEDPEAGERLVRELEAWDLTGDVHQVREQWELWAGWPLLGLVCLLLALEWALRRRHGML